MRRNSLTMLPAGMNGQSNGAHGLENNMEEWQHNATQTITRSLERTAKIRAPTSHSTIRTVTPDKGQYDGDRPRTVTPLGLALYAETSQTSPRSIAGGEKPRERRQGLIFNDIFDPRDSSPPQQIPLSPNRAVNSGPPLMLQGRARTRTLDEPQSRRETTSTLSKSRHRVGSVHSASSIAFSEDNDKVHPDPPSSEYSSGPRLRQGHLQHSGSIKERPGASRRLVKKSSTSSRPTSPLPSQTSTASLPVPVATTNANKILRLMTSLNGRIKSLIEYQTTAHGPWFSGICYINERGNLIYEGDDHEPFNQSIVSDLRGCRVRPAMIVDKQEKGLEIFTPFGSRLRLLPAPVDFDRWLAALLSWQQITPGTSQITLSIPEVTEPKWDSLSRTTSGTPIKGAAVIKVGKLLLWDKGGQGAPTALGRRIPIKEPVPAASLWRKVSCILQDNGEFKLMTENDVVLLSLIQLSQLSRCAIQQLDQSVLNEEYCIAIFPQYTPASTSISIIRPVYIALESRILFEVWFVLLRAFTVPEIYGSHSFPVGEDQTESSPESSLYTSSPDMFRIEKSLYVRIIEAKLRIPANKNDVSVSKRHSGKTEDPTRGDYFAEVILDGEVRARTMTKSDTTKPFWREDCEFLDLPSSLPELSIILKRISLSSESAIPASRNYQPDQGLEAVCGIVQIKMEQLERGKDLENWWPIFNDKQETIGEMFVKVRLDELVVLLAKDYQPISELLHKFSSGLTIQIAQTLSTDLRFLSETFLNIFQVSGQSAAWLIALVEDEIDGIGKETPVARLRFSRRLGSNDSFDSVSDRELSVRDMSKSLTGEANLLFRGNSLLTQALDFHMRRLGKEYLEDVLGDQVRQINALNPDCEVDPSRIIHNDNLSKNWTQLNALTSNVWESISSSAHRCSSELRQILKYIRAVADDRYGDFLRTVPYTSVSGFLFLRFFCPALLNPKLFGLLRDHPQPKAQRTLTLIAKSLQVLANLSRFGQKEEWMEPMNRFLSNNRQGVKDYIEDICAIPASRGVFTVPASYSTPITILGRLPPMSREGFPSLPYLIDHARNFAALVKLWLQHTADFHPPSTMDGDLLEFHEHCLELQRRTDECIHRAESSNIIEAAFDSDEFPPHWEDMIEDMESTSLQSSVDLQHSSMQVTGHSPLYRSTFSHSATPSSAGQSTKAPGSAGSEAGSKERRERQQFWEATFGKDSTHQQPYDPVEDVPQSSPPERGASRSEKRGFLSGLRKKEKEERKEKGKDKDRESEKEKRERYSQDARARERERGVSRDGAEPRPVSKEKPKDEDKEKDKKKRLK